MKTIAYYITGYGYGHASRSIAVIRRLLNAHEDLRIHVCSSFPCPFLRSSLEGYGTRVSFRDDYVEFEYILRPGSMEPDVDGTMKEYQRLMNQSQTIIERERQFLLEHHVDLVLTDICVFPIPAAHQAEIPVIGISNFTWYTAYSKILPKEMLHEMYSMYHLLDGFIALAGANEPNWGRRWNRELGFFSRESNEEEISRIRAIINPDGDKCIVFVGLGMKVSHEDCQSWRLWDDPDVCFVVSSNVNIKKENVFMIPSHELETQHYIAAADAIVTKVGWGAISEAVGHGTRLILTERGGMQEDDNTLAYLRKHFSFSTVPWEALKKYSFSALPVQTMHYYEEVGTHRNLESLDELTAWIINKLDK